jgi:TolB protein
MPREVNPDALSRAVANMQQVTFSHEGADFDPSVSPDGRAIVFASTQHRPTSDIYIKAANSRVVTRLTEDVNQDVMPAISPDGQFVVFSSNRSGNWDLYMMPASGGKAVQLTNDDANELHPSWSPDGSKIVFSRLGQTSQRWEMWIVDVQNTTGAQFIGYGLFPEWCPVPGTGYQGADKIVFQRSRERGDRAFSIWTIEYNDSPSKAGRETEIMTSRTHALINPSWSPDGRFVLYAAVPNPCGAPTGRSTSSPIVPGTRTSGRSTSPRRCRRPARRSLSSRRATCPTPRRRPRRTDRPSPRAAPPPGAARFPRLARPSG